MVGAAAKASEYSGRSSSVGFSATFEESGNSASRKNWRNQHDGCKRDRALCVPSKRPQRNFLGWVVWRRPAGHHVINTTSAPGWYAARFFPASLEESRGL